MGLKSKNEIVKIPVYHIDLEFPLKMPLNGVFRLYVEDQDDPALQWVEKSALLALFSEGGMFDYMYEKETGNKVPNIDTQDF
jgi:hypothetical protein